MQAKPQLVLDIAGVLVSNLSPLFWHELAQDTDIEFQTIRDQFNEIRKDLWTGRMQEEQLWDWLETYHSNLNKIRAREILSRTLQPLPSVHYLENWQRIADIHLLSNHCKEWLDPLLNKLEKYTTSITISNQVGLCKPDIQIYEMVEKQLDDKSFVLYIDDQEKNLEPAARLGWKTLLADRDGLWMEEVESILLRNS